MVLFPVTKLEHCNSGAPSHKGASRRTLARERAQYERQRHSHANLKHNLNLKSACAEGASGLNPITEPCRHSSAGQHWRSIYYLNPIDPGRALQRGRRSRVESSSRAISNLLFVPAGILNASSGPQFGGFPRLSKFLPVPCSPYCYLGMLASNLLRRFPSQRDCGDSRPAC